MNIEKFPWFKNSFELFFHVVHTDRELHYVYEEFLFHVEPGSENRLQDEIVESTESGFIL